MLLHDALGTIDTCIPELLPLLAAGRKVIAVELARLWLLGEAEGDATQRKITVPRRAIIGGDGKHGDVLAALGVPEPS